MLFSSIPGLPEVKQKIVQAVKNDHLAHALLFHGPEGSPNLDMALALATYLHCQNPQEEDSCGTCASCQRMAKLIHPDTNFAIPQPGGTSDDDDKGAKSDKIDFIGAFRNFVQTRPYGNISDWLYFNSIEKKQLNISKAAAKQIIQTLSLKSFEGGYKIMIIWCPEFLHINAANALLKIIEEPPAKTLFFLVTSFPDRLLTTILSRTQKIMVRAFSDEEIKAHLVAMDLCSPEAAVQIAPLADGNMREAFQLVDGVKDKNTNVIRDWFRACFSLDINAIFGFTENFSSTDKEGQKSMLLTGINVLREVLLDKSEVVNLKRSADEDRDFIHKLGEHVLSEAKLAKMYALLNEAHYHIERNANMKIMFADLSFQLARIMRAKETA
ncbi:MAG: DNA polymerase III subunit [Mongoliitalea sp.]